MTRLSTNPPTETTTPSYFSAVGVPGDGRGPDSPAHPAARASVARALSGSTATALASSNATASLVALADGVKALARRASGPR